MSTPRPTPKQAPKSTDTQKKDAPVGFQDWASI